AHRPRRRLPRGGLPPPHRRRRRLRSSAAPPRARVTAPAGVIAPVAGWWGFRPVPGLLRSRVRMAVNAALRAGPEQRGWTLILGTLGVAWWLGTHRIATALFSTGAPAPS